MKSIIAASVAALALSAPAKAETWFTIVSDRGCMISTVTPWQFDTNVNARGHGPTRRVVKHFDDGRFMFIDIQNVESTGLTNQYFFNDAATCLAAAQVMGVEQE